MQQTHEKFKDKNVVIIGVDLAEPVEVVRKYMGDRNYTWLIVLDAQQQVTVKYHVTGIPTSFFIDKAGVIRGIDAGPGMSQIAMERMINLASK